MNYDTGTARDEAYEGRALVAAFPDRESAHQAAHALHDEGFGRTWIGVTHPGETDTTSGAGGAYAGNSRSLSTQTQVTSDGDSLGDKIGRFFSGENGDRTLYDELVRHGVASTEARRIDGSLAPNSAILTVDGHNHPELAATLIEQNGGHILAGESFGTTGTGTSTSSDTLASTTAATTLGATTAATTLGTTGAYDAETDTTTRRGSDVLGYGDADSYARGEAIDEQRRIALREERLSIDKQRVSAGEVQITKDVVAHQQDIDVPVIREELFVERRPVSETTADTGEIGEIGQGETIRVPLMREQVNVTKRAVVTGEVVIGKREISENQRVSETTREEKLRVDGDTTNVRASGYDGDTSSTTGTARTTTGTTGTTDVL